MQRQHSCLPPPHSVFFQYPQADRRGCNRRCTSAPTRPGRLSVSTSGSKGVQHNLHPSHRFQFDLSVSTSGSKGVQQLVADVTEFTQSTFSIHKRIEGGATSGTKTNDRLLVPFQYPQADRRGCNLTQNVPKHFGCSLSVSTSGSKGVQQRTALTQNVPKHFFQYPQADRRGCNNPVISVADAMTALSVSTSGSKGVQPSDQEVERMLKQSFSIHKRIEGGATITKQVIHTALCNLSVSTSGSKGVQQPGNFGGGRDDGAFSIHKRIEGGATFMPHLLQIVFYRFQYPQADRRGCN